MAASRRASWRVREGGEVTSTPLAGCRQAGSALGFGYARLRPGESLASGEGGVNFLATDAKSGQRLWTEVGGAGSRIYERTRSSERPFTFGGGGVANGGGMKYGGPTNGQENGAANGAYHVD